MGPESALSDVVSLPATSRHGEAVVVAGALLILCAEDNRVIV
jgi:hypothetical protein